MTVKNVTIGDKFIASNDLRTKRVSTVVDFAIRTSIITGETIGELICIAEKIFPDKAEKFETAFATVVRNKVK